MINRAKELATRAHEGQFRKYNGLPYIVHPAQVAKCVEECKEINVALLDTAICAAWLHDVLEDTDVSESEIESTTNREVLLLVKELTNVPSIGSREERKAKDRERLSSISPLGKLIKKIDRTCNMQDMIHDSAPTDFLLTYFVESTELFLALGQNGHGVDVNYLRATNKLGEYIECRLDQ